MEQIPKLIKRIESLCKHIKGVCSIFKKKNCYTKRVI